MTLLNWFMLITLWNKFPPVPLLEAYVTQSKEMAQEIKKNGKNSKQAQSEAASKEMGALQSVLKAIEDCKLEKQYPLEGLEKRIIQLEQQKDNNKKRNAAVAAVSNSKNQQQPKNRPRPQPPVTTSAHPITTNLYPPSHQTHPQHGLFYHAYPQLDLTNHAYPQHGLTDHTSYMAGPYGLASSGSTMQLQVFLHLLSAMVGLGAHVGLLPIHLSHLQALVVSMTDQ